MPSPSSPNLIPGVTLKIGDKQATTELSEAYDDLLDVEVEDDLAAPSMCTIRMQTFDSYGNKITWADDGRFALGKAIEVGMGYKDGDIKPVFKGEITGLEFQMTSEEGEAADTTFVVRACDRRHRLLRGTHTRTFLDVTDSEIASQLALAAGLTAATKNTSLKHPYVAQYAEADLMFLSRRAEAIGYEIGIDDWQLTYQPRKNDQKPKSPDFDVTSEDDIIDLSTRVTARDLPASVVVHGWDPKEQKAIVATAKPGDLKDMGGDIGLTKADAAYVKGAKLDVIDRTVDSPDDATKIAQGLLGGVALEYVKGEATCYGRPELRAGVVINLKTESKRFSGAYYVVSAKHTYAPWTGYRTRLTLRRNSA